jgi:molybdopterin synthase catalytic subunit
VVEVSVSVTDNDIDPGRLATVFYAHNPHGAVTTFTGFVRDFNAQGSVQTLYLECYVEMAERVLHDLGAEAEQRFGLKSWQIVHRFGSLSNETPIVFVATSADHRAEAFSACEFVMDTLKTDAPFWKREDFEGEGQWVTVATRDVDRKKRWETKDPSS